ncbi:hypothetical protein QEN19_003411 [Hanseniaspora menglaensis]
MDQYLAKLAQCLQSIVSGKDLKETTALLQKEIYNQPQCVPALVQLIMGGAEVDASVKTLAAVELRKQVYKHWEALDDATSNGIKETLIGNLFSIDQKNVRHAVARVIGEIGSIDIDNGKWNDLLPSLFQAASNPDTAVRETAMYVVLTLVETFIAAIANSINQFLDLLSITLQEAPENTLETRCLSVQTFNLLGQLIDESIESADQQTLQKFQSLFSYILLVLQTAIQREDESKAQEVFNSLNDFLLFNNKLAGNNVLDMIKACLQIASNTDIDEEIRCHAIRFLTTSISYKKSKIIQAQLGSDITVAALKISSEEVDVEDELTNEDEANENEENTPVTLATRLLYFTCTELPPSQVTNLIINSIPEMLSSQNIFAKRAVFTALEVAVAGSPDYVLNNLDTKVIGAVLEGLKNDQPIVQLSALKALSSLSSELQSDVTKHYESFIPLIIQIIDNAKSVVIYRHATKALDGFLEFMSLENIAKFMEPLMEKLFSMLETSNSSKLRCEIVSAIGSAAFASGSAFIPYFNKSIEYLQNFIQPVTDLSALSEDDIELRALTFENVSTIGRAVKAEVFNAFAENLMQAAYQGIKCDNSRIREACYAFVGNMAKVYGKDFSPYLSTFMPEIYNTLKQEEYDINTDGLDLNNLDEEAIAQKFQVNTGVTFEKEVATAALTELVVATKEAFMPFVQDTINILVEEVDATYGLKESMIITLWSVVSGVIDTAYPELKNKFPKGIPAQSYISPEILAFVEIARKTSLETLPDEYEITVVTSILESLTEALNKYGAIILVSNSSDTSFLDTLCSQLVELLQGKHIAQSLDEEYEDEEEHGGDMDVSESDSTLTNTVLEALTALSNVLSVQEFTTIFTSVQHLIFSLMSSSSKAKRSHVIGSVAEICLNLGAENPFITPLLEQFVNKLSSDKSLEVRGNAAYGVGVLVQNAINVDVSSAYQVILKSLFEVLTVANSKTLDEESTKEVVDRSISNSCGCLSRMILHNDSLIPLNATLPPLLEQLPLSDGYEEYEPIFEVLLKLFSKQDPIAIENAPKVIDVLESVFAVDAEREELMKNTTIGRDLALDKMKQFSNDEIKQKIISLVQFLKTQYPEIIANKPHLQKI